MSEIFPINHIPEVEYTDFGEPYLEAWSEYSFNEDDIIYRGMVENYKHYMDRKRDGRKEQQS